MRRKYSPEQIEAVKIFLEGMNARGYKAVPFQIEGRPVKELRYAHGVVWRKGGKVELDMSLPNQGIPDLHNLQMTMYLGPPQKNEPAIYVFNIDQYDVSPFGCLEKKIQRDLEIPFKLRHVYQDKEGKTIDSYYLFTASGKHAGMTTQIYVLEHELKGFATWQPDWVLAMDRGKMDELPPQPYPFDGGGGVRIYNWTYAAMRTYRAWEEVVQRGRDEDGQPTNPLTLN